MSGWRRAFDLLDITELLEDCGPTVPTDFPTLFLLLSLRVSSPLFIFVVCLLIFSPQSPASETISKSSLGSPRCFASWRCNKALYAFVKCNTNGWILIDNIYHWHLLSVPSALFCVGMYTQCSQNSCGCYLYSMCTCVLCQSLCTPFSMYKYVNMYALLSLLMSVSVCI